MAFIPDDAIDDCTDISPSAFRLYCIICRKRSHRNGFAFLGSATAQRLLALSRSQIYAAARELQVKGWIHRDGHQYYPQKGDFTPVNKWLMQRQTVGQSSGKIEAMACNVCGRKACERPACDDARQAEIEAEMDAAGIHSWRTEEQMKEWRR